MAETQETVAGQQQRSLRALKALARLRPASSLAIGSVYVTIHRPADRGPGDETDRFRYGALRLRRGGEISPPATAPTRQFVTPATWQSDRAAWPQREAGVFNADGSSAGRC